jgi:lipopolysaccharide assembly outer membrane protein LptD (OstA)
MQIRIAYIYIIRVPLFWILRFFIFFIVSNFIYAQKPLNPPTPTGPKTRIELVKADSLVGTSQGGTTIYEFVNNVAFKHNGSILYCQRAFLNVTTNTVDTYGKVKIVQGDTLTITGDTLYYDGNIRFAKVYGKKVVMKDKKVTLTTRLIEYDMARSNAYYPVFGEIIDEDRTLTSNRGYYNTKYKIFNYKENVLIKSPKYTIKTDSLEYNANNKIATFKTITTVEGKDKEMVVANSGTYNTATEESNFKGRSSVVNVDFTLVGDTLIFDSKTESGIAWGNVDFYSYKDKISLHGNKMIRNGKIGYTQVIGKALMRNFQEKDTLLTSADHFHAYEDIDSTQISKKDTIKKERKMKKLIADGNVKIFRNDMQSKCDSLYYNLKDSVIHFFQSPILWTKDNQLEADSIWLTMRNNKIHQMFLRVKSFVVSQDTSQNFNQIKGRKITATFNKETRLDHIIVEGNGESVYYALDDKNHLIGINRVDCGKMNLKFAENKVNRISFIGKPDARLVPPKEITNEEVKLDGFEWKVNKKPTKKDVLGSKFALK